MSDIAGEIAQLQGDVIVAETAAQTAVIAADAAVVAADLQTAQVTAQAAETIGAVVQTVNNNEEEIQWLRNQMTSLEVRLAEQSGELLTLREQILAQTLILSQVSPSPSSPPTAATPEPAIPLSEVVDVPLEPATDQQSEQLKEKKLHRLL